MVCPKYQSQGCSVVGALAAIEDPLSPLILQEALFNGTTLVSEFASAIGVPADTIANALAGLVGSDLMALRADAEDPALSSYIPTQKGSDLAPAMAALAIWADRWAPDGEPSRQRAPEGCGEILEQLIRCHGCGESPPDDQVREPPDLDAEILTAALNIETSDGIPSVGPASPNINIHLLGVFAIAIEGVDVSSLTNGTQRLLAYLALHDHAVTRLSMAGTMWPEVSDQSAGGSLRSALSRLDPPTRDAVLTASGGIGLESAVVVDIREARALAHRLLEHGAAIEDADLSDAAVALLSLELLPGWYDDWVLAEADDWRVLRRNALEAQAVALCEQDRWSEAAGAARVAGAIDPLRESPQACLIRVHLARGNQSEALQVYNTYKELLFAEIGLEPTVHMKSLVSNLQS
jgi:DNA-binding SARP family transcriptional activator/DNA-binding HxlR family transcriptional regulator